MTMQTTTKPRPGLRPIPLTIGYALSKLRPLHRFMPDRMLYRLPISWNFEMLRSFLTHRLDRVYIDIHCKLDRPPSYAPRVKTDGQYALSEGDVRRFYDDGFLGPFDLCPPEEMNARSQHMWSLWESPSKTYPKGTYEFVGDTLASQSEGEMSNEEYACRGLNARDKHLEDPVLLDMFAHPAVVERVAQLLGPDLLFWRSQFFPKYPKMGGTGWHQASSYLNETMRWATLTPPDLSRLFQLTVWIALTDSTKENGCLRVVRGTHREIQPMVIEEYDAVKHADNKSDRFGTKLMRPYHDVDESKVIDLEMKAGQFVIFTERVMHGSLPNVTADQSRLGVSGRYVQPSVKIHNPWVLGEGGLDIVYLRIKKLQLDRWKAIVVRGEDRAGVNAGRVISLGQARG
jgi:non-heme Fe2+,alpha-ketoglutarate-dependent halogenase